MAASEQLAIDFAPDVSPQNTSADELPEGWRVARLDQVCETNPSRKGRTNYPDDLPVTFVSMSAVDEGAGTIATPDVRPFSEVKKGYTWFIENDVLFAKISPCMQNGKAAVARGLSNGVGFGSTEFHVLRPGPDVLPEWIHLFIRQLSFREAVAHHFTGSVGQQRVPESVVRAQVIPVPPLTEQRRIVARIEELAARIERARGLRREAAEGVGVAWPLILAQCFVPTMDMVMSLESVCEAVIDNLHSTPRYDGEEFLCIRSQDIGWGTINYAVALKTSGEEFIHRTQRGEPCSGDIVYVREGDVGRCAVVDGSHRFSLGQRVMMFRPNVGTILPRFLLLQLMSSPVLDDQVRSGKTGATAHHVNIKQLRQIRINVPPLIEQQCIVDYLNSFQAKVDMIKRLQAANAVELDALLPAVLARAFRGEL